VRYLHALKFQTGLLDAEGDHPSIFT
jgi:hypothetical protein